MYIATLTADAELESPPPMAPVVTVTVVPVRIRQVVGDVVVKFVEMIVVDVITIVVGIVDDEVDVLETSVVTEDAIDVDAVAVEVIVETICALESVVDAVVLWFHLGSARLWDGISNRGALVRRSWGLGGSEGVE